MSNICLYRKGLLVISYLFFIAHNHAMENNMMVGIRSEKDLVPFVGKVVAFDMSFSFDPFTANIGCDPDCYEWVAPYQQFIKYGYKEDTSERKGRMRAMLTSVMSREGRYLLFPDVYEDILYIKYGYVDGKGYGNRRMKSLDGRLLSKEDTCRMFPGLNDSYMLHILLRNDAFDCTSHILHKGHFKSELKMRNIIQAEAAHILNVVKHREAKFSYWNEEPPLLPKILQFLEQAQK